jgi:hypothetical protein
VLLQRVALVEAYYSSNGITFFFLRRSGNCHSTACTRLQLWNRLAQVDRGTSGARRWPRLVCLPTA